MSECRDVSSDNILDNILGRGDFSRLKHIYDKHVSETDNNNLSILEFYRLFEKSGKQGYVGIMHLKQNENNSRLKCVFKISQYVNYLVHHEYIIMKGLTELAPFCPHFCRILGVEEVEMDAKFKKDSDNPFEIQTKYPVRKDVMLCEYISESNKFYNMIRGKYTCDNVIYSCVKQVLMATAIAQKQKRFTHYDMHSLNIMVKQCDPNIVFLYVLDNDNQFLVPTHGNYPVIIDYGFSYIGDMDNGPLWTSLAHTDVGFMSDRFDWVADPKLFLVTVSSEIQEHRPGKQADKFRNIVRNIFKPLKIDWECGWDNEVRRGAADYVMHILDKYSSSSILFSDWPHYCIDVLQSLIILPLQEQDYGDIEIAFTTFINEWIKIENEINNPYYNLYILKNMVSLARKLLPVYMDENTQTKAVTAFRRAMFELLNEITSYCRPKNVHFEKLLCSLYVLAKCVEGILYEVMDSRMTQKTKQYELMPLSSTEQIFAAIDVNIPSVYKYTDKTRVVVLDCVNKTTKEAKIPNSILSTLNSVSPLIRGSILYSALTENQNK